MKLGTFHFGDDVLFGDSVQVADGSALAAGFSYPYGKYSGGGWSWPQQEWSYPGGGPGWSWPWGDWSYPDGWSYTYWDGWSYQAGWSWPWSYPHLDGWSYEDYDDWSYDGGWSYDSGWSHPRTFAVEAEHFRARKMTLTSYKSYWWMQGVERGVDGTTEIAHPRSARVAPVSWGTLETHPQASGFRAYHLHSDADYAVKQILDGYVANRRHILSVYAWNDGDDDATIELEVALASKEGVDDWGDSSWSGWTMQYDANFRRLSPDEQIESGVAAHVVPAGKKEHRYWVTIPPKRAGQTMGIRVRASSGDFFVDRIKTEMEPPLDTGQVTSAGEDWLEDSDKSWPLNEYADKKVVIVSGNTAPQVRTVTSNTHDRLTIEESWTLTGNEFYELYERGSNARPSPFIEDTLIAGWMQSIRAENIVGGLLTLGGSTVSGAVGGARMRILDGNDDEIVVIGENIGDDAYRGVDLKGGSGIRIADGSGGMIEIGDNMAMDEDGYYAYNEDGARTIWLKSGGGFVLATGSEWRQRLEFDDSKGFTFYDDANIPFVSFNPQTATCYLGREYQPHISITPAAVTVHGDLIVDGTITATKLIITQISDISTDLGEMATATIADLTCGVINVTGEYQYGGVHALTMPGLNLFVGEGAGASRTSGNDNVLMGYEAGFSLTTGGDNVFIGYQSGYANTDGGFNVIIGPGAGVANIGGDGNVFIGAQAGEANTEGDFNVFVGELAGQENTTGRCNTFVGEEAGLGNQTGESNVYLGYYSAGGSPNGARNRNVFVGAYTGLGGAGSDNVFVGHYAGSSESSGDQNVIVGSYAVQGLLTGNNNVVVGYQSGYSLTSGAGNVFIGYQSGYSETTGSNKLYIENSNSATPLIYGEFDNDILHFNAASYVRSDTGLFVGLGDDCSISVVSDDVVIQNLTADKDIIWKVNDSDGGGAGQEVVRIDASTQRVGILTAAPNNSFEVAGLISFDDTSYNILLGTEAGDNDAGAYNTFFGYQAGYYNDTSGGGAKGSENVYIGFRSGYGSGASNSGYENVGIGSSTLLNNTTGWGNFALGQSVLISNTTGRLNTGIGGKALELNESGIYNVGIGRSSLRKNVSGGYNTAIGNSSLYTNEGSYNIGIGFEALVFQKSGNYNVAIGGRTGFGDGSSFSNNVLIGHYAGYSLTTGSGNIFIGYRAGYSETGSNKLYIENSNSATPLIYGEFDNDILHFNAASYVRSDTGLFVGLGDDCSISISSDDVVIQNLTADKDIIFKVNDSDSGGAGQEVMWVDGSTQYVGVGVSPSYKFQVQAPSGDSMIAYFAGVVTEASAHAGFANTATAHVDNITGFNFYLRSSTQVRAAGSFRCGFSTITDASRTSYFALRTASAGSIATRLGITGKDVGIGTLDAAPSGRLHVDQEATGGAIPTLVLDQADEDYVLIKIIGTAAAASADRTLVAASDFTTPGALVGWVQIEVEDIGDRITDGDYYQPVYAAPTA